MPQKSPIANDFNEKASDFLRIEIETGLTFATIALAEQTDSEKRTRLQANALKAYQTVLRLRDRVNTSHAIDRNIQNGLDHLRSVLEKLGEKLS